VEPYLCSPLYVPVAMTGGTLPLLRVISFGAQWLKVKFGAEIFEYVLSSLKGVWLGASYCVTVTFLDT